MSEYRNISAGLAARLALERHGFRFTHSLGQNFILDDNLLERLLDLALIEPGARVLEIGPGAGVMTRLMAERGADVTAVELDETLRPVLEDMTGGYANVRLIFADALKADLRALMGDEPFSVIANLPYYIATELIEKLLTAAPRPRCLTVMVQKEAAERMTAAPGGKTWCALSATVQYFARCETVMELPPAAFTPPPHVDSALLRLEPYAGDAPVRAADDAMMLRVIRSAFAMRRKTLANNLTAAFALPREAAVSLIESLGLDARVRGEALSLEQLAALSDRLSAR